MELTHEDLAIWNHLTLANPRITVRYCVRVRQFALKLDAHDFELMQGYERARADVVAQYGQPVYCELRARSVHLAARYTPSLQSLGLQ